MAAATGGDMWRTALSGRASTVAPRLLGAVLTVAGRSGRIVEVEAYEADDDAASHAHRGPTSRTAVMFGPPGRLYVYLSYGVHWCANIVCHQAGEAGAVLIRAIEPVAGIDEMWKDRPAAKLAQDLGSGPGKLCAALAIDQGHNGVDLFEPGSGIDLNGSGRAPDGNGVLVGPRIGISKAKDKPWRFGLADNPHLSKPFGRS